VREPIATNGERAARHLFAEMDTPASTVGEVAQRSRFTGMIHSVERAWRLGQVMRDIREGR